MKKLSSRFAALFMILLLIVNTVSFAALGVDNGEFSGGDGSEENPFLVSTPEQLNNVRNHLDSHFKQIADIDMALVSNWKPIGNAGSCSGSTLTQELPEVSYEPFIGSYDGNNYRISNLSINDSKVSFASDVYGLFSALGKCTIKNVHLTGIKFSIDKATTDYVNLWKEYGASYGVYVGGIAGKGTGDSLVSNCSCSGTISVVNCNDAFVGGILGYGKAEKCENSTDIYVDANSSSRYETDSTVHCGGIVGHTPSVNAVVSECLNQGNLNATAGDFLYVGGISGEYGRIENCMNCGDVEGHIIKNSRYSSFAGNCNAGGIVGATSSDYTKYCVNYGNVSANTNTYTWSASSYAGGIVGFCGYYDSGKVFNCVNIGNSISSSKKDKNEQTVDAQAGRIAGYANSISECYSVNTTTVNGSTVSGNNTDINGESVSSTTLLTQKPYIEYDLNSIWFIDANLGGAVLLGFYTEILENISTQVSGTFELYKLTVVINGNDSWITAVIDGKEYKVSKEVISTDVEAECYVGKKVVAFLVDDEIIWIKTKEETNINKTNWNDNSSNTVDYGAKSYQATKASQVLESTSSFINAMQDYISLLGNEAGDAEVVDIDGIVKELKNNNQAYFSLTADAPNDAINAAYYGIANFIVEVANSNQLYLEVNPQKSASEQAISLVNSIRRSIFSTSETYYHGKYSITIDALLEGQAYTGQIRVTKKGNVNGVSYIGPIVSSKQRTLEVFTAYINNLSDIVKDQCKYALASIYNEFMTVSGIAEAEEEALNSFFSDKIDILISKGYGNVLATFQMIKTGYNAIKKFKTFTTTMGDAETFLSYDNFENAKWMYNQLNDLDFSKEGAKKRSVKEAISLVNEAKKDLADKLYNYLYNVDSGDPANDTFWDKTKSWFSNAWKCITVQCPVEFEIYDSSGNMIGFVDSSENHDGYVYHSNDIHITVEGDVKYIYYPSNMEITVKLTAIDDGEMNYSIEEFNNGIPSGKINIFNVPLTRNETYQQTIPANCDIQDSVDILSLSTSEEVIACTYSSADDLNAHIRVDCLSSCGGFVIGDGDYPIGSSVKMMAFADGEDKEFQGWYLNGICVSQNEIYQFTAKENVKLAALFRTKHIHSYISCEIENSSCTDYGEIVYTCKCGDNYKRIIELKDHIDENGDGLCDECDATVDNSNSTQKSNCVCGKYHTGTFAKLIKFFHKIIYFFKNLFSKYLRITFKQYFTLKA